MNKIVVTGLLASLALAVGCSHDAPDRYGEERPPIAEIDLRDRGLQSKDVAQASDEMAMKLLADPDLNSSNEKWLMVVDRVENQTVNARHSLDIFLQRLQTNLARHGKGRVQLVQNRLDFDWVDIQSTADDHVLVAADDGKITLRVDVPVVARFEETVGREILSRPLGHPPILPEYIRSAHLNIANLIGRQVHPILINHPNVQAG